MSDTPAVRIGSVPATISQRIDPRNEAWAWWFRFNLVGVMAVFVLVGTALVAGPGKWTHGNSLQVLHNTLPIPWPAWGCLFYLLVLLLGREHIGRVPTRLVGYFAGMLVAFFFICLSIVFSVLLGKFTNPITIGLSTLSVPQLMSGVRYSVIVYKDRRRADR